MERPVRTTHSAALTWFAQVGQWSKQGGQRYLLENVRAGMSEPGDWYWDEGAGEVRLVPPAATAAAAAATTPPLYAIAPQLSTLLRVLNGASYVTLLDLVLSHASGGDRVGVYHTNSAAVSIGGTATRPSTDIKLQRVAVRDCGGAGIYAKAPTSCPGRYSLYSSLLIRHGDLEMQIYLS
jgi:hypothetical protein